ncbi:hypothetical protein [Brevundimonas nasdae]|uniref:hypothetical protein n=1 Tax=Brevundimonas nasdae TaxID=172043 RepID=UPI00301A1C8F
MLLPLALHVMASLANIAAQQNDRPGIIYMGPHPQVVKNWSADYNFDCGERQVSVSLTIIGGVAHVTKVDLGRGPVIEPLSSLNRALSGQNFNDLQVICTRVNPSPHLMFRTFRPTSDGGAEPASVSLESIGAAAADVQMIER